MGNRLGVSKRAIPCRQLRDAAGRDVAAGEIDVAAAEHKLVASDPLVRSQALSTLYEAARRGEISAVEGIERATRINSLKVRFLGDVFVTFSDEDLARAVSGLVKTATIDALRTA